MESRQVVPGSITLNKLISLAKVNAPGEKEWQALTVSQRQQIDEAANRLKVERANRHSLLYELARIIEHLLNWSPKTKDFIVRLVGPADTGTSVVQLGISSTQMVTWLMICKKLGLGLTHTKEAFKFLIGMGSNGVKLVDRITAGVLTGNLADLFLRYKSALGCFAIFVVFLKAASLFSEGKWGPACAELVKSVVCLVVPVFGFWDAIIALIDALFHPNNPLWDFVKKMNPADMIKDAVASLLSIIGVFWEAWTRNDWGVYDVIKNGLSMIGGEILKRGVNAVWDILMSGWRAIEWVFRCVTGTAQYGFTPHRSLAVAVA